MTVKLHLNRSRNCRLCGKQRYRIQLSAPKIDDPDYVVAVCPDCDLISTRNLPKEAS